MTQDIKTSPQGSPWKEYEKTGFRFFFLYFLLQAFPLDPRYFGQVFSLPWGKLRYQDIFTLAHYTPRFFGAVPSFADWGVIVLLALIGAGIWTFTDKGGSKSYDSLYYWIRVVVRYRLAIGLLAYGFIKLYPLQSPYPSLSNLNTHYGDFTRWKLFSLSLGIVPSYEAFLGGVEIAAGLLLLFRKTSSIGALIVIFFTGNVFMSNLAYEGGEYVYSAYLVSLALFVLAFNIRRLTSLLVFQEPTAPNTFKPALTEPWQRYGRLGLKTLTLFFFVVLFGFRTGWGYHHDPYQYPGAKGLAGASGLYNVTLFRVGKDTLPYSPTDSVRWKNVVFERWATVSIAGNRPAAIDQENTEKVTAVADIDKTYELEGTSGRSYYNYGLDTVNHLLTLRNKNVQDSTDKWVLQYARPDNGRIILSGVNAHNDSVYIVLDRIDKRYLLEEAAKTGRGRTLKL
jgi:hypothetical protein